MTGILHGIPECGVGDLPYMRWPHDRRLVTSVWRPTPCERIAIAYGADVQLTIVAAPGAIPPADLAVGFIG